MGIDQYFPYMPDSGLIIAYKRLNTGHTPVAVPMQSKYIKAWHRAPADIFLCNTIMVKDIIKGVSNYYFGSVF